MRRGLLSELFVGVVAKRLTLVETITPRSNQHEFQGTKPLRSLLGEEDRKGISARFIWLSGEQEALAEDGFVSWSNVRKGKPRAAEFHLYYSGNTVTEMMRPDDVLFLALQQNGDVLVIVTPALGTVQNQLSWLFGLEVAPEFSFVGFGGGNDAELDYIARYILDELGIDPEEPDADYLDHLVEPFGLKFPTTAIFSDAARKSRPDLSALDAPDDALTGWLDREEAMFRRLERRIVAARIGSGFGAVHEADVDGFLSFSLSVQNRRKSRAGRALENHLQFVLSASGVQHSRGALTENGNRPDFLFPGAAEYQNPAFPAARLTMLGAKSTLKERWRQVLSEAARIEDKHLLTLEPSISENQTGEMTAKRLRLVVPRPLHITYRPAQQAWLMDVREFIALARERQQS